MRQKPQWIEVNDFHDVARAVIAEAPERYSRIALSSIIAYVSPTHPTLSSKRRYEMTGETEPECMLNTKRYFVKLSMNDWQSQTADEKKSLVATILDRIDPDTPGHVTPGTHSA